MAVFIDSSVIIGLINSKDKNHSRAIEVLAELSQVAYGRRITMDYVMDEVLTTLWQHTHQKEVVLDAYKLIRKTPDFIRLEYMTPLLIDKAWKKWKKLAHWPKKPLSFTDCCILSFMEKYNVKHLASFNSDFKGLVLLVETGT